MLSKRKHHLYVAMFVVGILSVASLCLANDYCDRLLEAAERSGLYRREVLEMFEAFLLSTERLRGTRDIAHDVRFEGDPVRVQHPKENLDAIKRIVKVTDKNGNSHSVDVYYPDRTNRNELANVFNSLGNVPLKLLRTFDKLIVHDGANPKDAYWSQHYKDFTRSAATAGRRTINFYKSGYAGKSYDLILSVIRHEFGHTFAEAIFGTANPPPEWVESGRRDPRFVSEYAKNAACEDFAETIRVYLESGAGVADGWRNRVPNRFAELDKYFGFSKAKYRKETDVSELYLRAMQNPKWVESLEKIWADMHYQVLGERPSWGLTDGAAESESGKQTILFFNRVTGTMVYIGD
ncbi:hypothetical protein E3A20_08510 [Planctomyces bekefii]|uniref:Uncharacterized protein n=1 Tax=Planctomyces bekefii TaxID=1653850 RepID=A0A5C6M5G1_9PLAN|nr:hypothetical protein E3A20_08510 [Planctomyces bekefii]